MLPDKVDKIQQGFMLNHNSLGISRGARGVNHVGQMLRRVFVIQGRCRALGNLRHDFLCKGDFGLGICQHILHPGGRIIQINGKIGRANLPNADDCRQKFLHPAHADGYEIIFLCALLPEPVCDFIG